MRKGIDPGAQRKAEKVADSETFEAVAWPQSDVEQWIESRQPVRVQRRAISPSVAS